MTRILWLLIGIEARDTLSRFDFGLVARLADNIPALKLEIILQLKTNITKELVIASKKFDNLQSAMTTLCFVI